MLYAAATIIVLLGIAHSALGERFIITRLLRRNDLPKVLGSSEFTKHTLRYCWHLTTVMALGMAYLLIQIEHGDVHAALVRTLAVTLIVSAVLAIIVTRARHLSWIGLIIAAAMCFRYAGLPTL